MSKPRRHRQRGVGGDVVAGNKTVIQQAGGDIVGRDKITYAAPPAGVAALHQLPPPPADFTGRDVELAELRQAVRQQGAAISGLRGLGGVGKTALALVLAHELAADYPDAQLFINLQGITQPLTTEAVMAQVIRAYRPVEQLPDDPAQLAGIYRSVLAGQRALLLFDNARDAAQIRPLLPPAGCRLLVTSRQNFALPGLQAVNLKNLLPGDSETLLLKLAPRIGDQAGRLAELCGYLPLALTVAGSALAEREDLEPETYIERLERARLTLLGEVEASLALSADLLPPELRRLWYLLAVFPADFDAPAAAAVWSLELEPAGDRLSDLLRFSLLEFNPESKRYRLHDLAREFAGAQLSDSERAAARLRHAAYYKDVLADANRLYRAGAQNALSGLAWFDRERLNIVAGQAWAAANAEHDDTAARLTGDYPDAGVYVLMLRQHPREKLEWLTAGLSAARRLGDRGLASAHLGNLGLAYSDLGQPRRAIEFHEQALDLDRDLGNRRGEANALGNLGLAYISLGEPGRAIGYCQKQLAIAREIGDRHGEGRALGNLGNAYNALSEPQRAVEHFELALPILRDIGDRYNESVALGNLGNAYFALSRPREALRCFQQRLIGARELGDRRGEAIVLGNLANTYAGLGDDEQALTFYGQALALLHDLGDRQAEVTTSWNLGYLYEKQGDLRQAIALMQPLVDYARQHGHPAAATYETQLAELRQRAQGG